MKISAIIPAYNTDKWIKECLDSLLKQTISFYEILIIDDCSADSTLAIAREYEAQNSLIKVYAMDKNYGPGYARNYGVLKAKGDYILFIDSDDLLRIDALEKLVSKNLKEIYDAVYYNSDVFGLEEYCDNTNYHRHINPTEVDGVTGEMFFSIAYPNGYFASPCLCLYKKNVIIDRKIFFPEGVFFEDECFSFKYLHEAKCVCYIDECLYIRRYREGSTVTTKDIAERLYGYKKCFTMINNYINDKYKNKVSDSIIQFVFDMLKIVLDLHHELKQKSDNREWKDYIQSFDKLLNRINYKDNLGVLLTLEQILEREKKDNLNFHKKKISLDQVRGRIDELYKEILRKIPLNDENIKIGIYGNGKHTLGLFSAFRNYIGDIKAKVYIVTTDSFEQYNEIELDYIFISSFKYASEMLPYAKRCFSQDKIIYIYDSLHKDIFSSFDMNQRLNM